MKKKLTAMVLALGAALGAWAGMVNLSTLTGDYVAKDGDTLTFKKDGAVAFAGKVDGAKVSGSSQLVLRLAETGSPYQVTLYAPPPKGTLVGFCKTFAVTLTVDEQTADVKVEVVAE